MTYQPNIAALESARRRGEVLSTMLPAQALSKAAVLRLEVC